jgi:hypothetical protein
VGQLQVKAVLSTSRNSERRRLLNQQDLHALMVKAWRFNQPAEVIRSAVTLSLLSLSNSIFSEWIY